jgi:predicted DNA repair protein MutK
MSTDSRAFRCAYIATGVALLPLTVPLFLVWLLTVGGIWLALEGWLRLCKRLDGLCGFAR